MEQFIHNSLEYKNWGWNAATVAFSGTCFFLVVGFWGLIDQNRKIWRAKSGRSVSVAWFTSSAAFFSVTVPYGLHIGSIASVLSGFTRVPLTILVLIGLRRYKGFTAKENVFAVFCALYVLAYLVMPYKHTMYLVIAFGGLIPACAQPIEMIRTRSSGVVSLKLLVVRFGASAFWTAYSVTLEQWPLVAFSLAVFFHSVLTISLWFKYRKPTPHGS